MQRVSRNEPKSFRYNLRQLRLRAGWVVDFARRADKIYDIEGDPDSCMEEVRRIEANIREMQEMSDNLVAIASKES